MITVPYVLLKHAISGTMGLLCLVCHRLSWNPNDVREHYCAGCHQYLDNLPEDVRREKAYAVVRTYLLQAGEP